MAKILIVDDSPVVKKIITTNLVKEGYEVIDASDGASALEIIQEEKIDFLITDLNMPKMDGMQLIKELRKNPSYKWLPIVMLTTNPSEEEKALEAGANLYLKKPVRFEVLLETIQKHVK